jgi:hypothetical protein
MAGLRSGGRGAPQGGDQVGQLPQAAGGEDEWRAGGERDGAGRLDAAGRQQLPPAVGPRDHQLRLALVALAPHHGHELACQRVMGRDDPHAFDVTRMQLLSLLADVPPA